MTRESVRGADRKASDQSTRCVDASEEASGFATGAGGRASAKGIWMTVGAGVGEREGPVVAFSHAALRQNASEARPRCFTCNTTDGYTAGALTGKNHSGHR